MRKNKKETVSQTEKDVIKLTAYFRVYADRYSTSSLGLDCGKYNLESYFCDRLGWSFAKLKRLVTMMVDGVILYKDTKHVEPGFHCYVMYSNTRESIRRSLHIMKLFGEEPSIL